MLLTQKSFRLFTLWTEYSFANWTNINLDNFQKKSI